MDLCGRHLVPPVRGIQAVWFVQHSSFLHGARILSAGLVKIKHGQLRRLSPLSGHYRPPAANFRAFVHSLRDEGADMSHVSISRSYAVLVGLETYTKARKRMKKAEHSVVHEKDKLLNPEKIKMEEEAKRISRRVQRRNGSIFNSNERLKVSKPKTGASSKA